MPDEIEVVPSSGPLSWRNWLAAAGGGELQAVTEVRLFTEAWFTSEARGIGPYNFINALPRTPTGGTYSLKPAAVLRTELYLSGESPDFSKTSSSHYHGGWLYDEIAALVSLVFGVRVMAGPTEREYGYGSDEWGQPRGHTSDYNPILPPAPEGRVVMPPIADSCLVDLSRLKTIPRLDCAQATALIKSARLYQQAIWIADAMPHLAWLMLVSALETAAVHWRTGNVSAAESLTRSLPNLARILEERGGDELLNLAASELEGLTGPTTKFVNFVLHFAPPPPEVRPQVNRFDYRKKSLRYALGLIYAHRSRALHDGIPFPHPMCSPPRGYAGVAEEAPLGLATSTLNGVWLLEDTPMLFHVFAHIARGTLLNWWASMVREEDRLT